MAPPGLRVIAGAVRTPFGRFGGTLAALTAPELGALVVREAVRRAGIDPAAVDECIMGNVVAAGEGQNPARQAALNGGLHEHVAAMTINKVCGSGLKAVMLAAQGIATGDVDVVAAGGMESMSNCPYLMPRVREGLRMGNGEIVDSMIHDGLWCAFEGVHMGNAGETVAECYHVGREAQDAFAARSHAKAAAATAEQGYRTLAAFAIRDDSELVAILIAVFRRTADELDMDERTLDAIGRVLDISFANRRLRVGAVASELRYRELFEGSPDAIVVENHPEVERGQAHDG